MTLIKVFNRMGAACKCCLLILCLSATARNCFAHGQVKLENDACVIQIGVFTAHFKLYQPQARQQEEFCEDLPGTGETVLVMEYISTALAEASLELRIIRDVAGAKGLSRLEDVAAIEDLEGATVFYQPPTVDRDVFTTVFNFDRPGWYIGIFTVHHPELDEFYTAVFSIKVGYTGPGYLAPLLAVLILLQLGYWWMSGQLGRWRQRFRARRLGQPADGAT